MISEIKTALKEGKVVIGTKNTIKNLRSGKSAKVFLTSNTPKEIKEKIKKYAKLTKTELVQLKIPNNELGTICKKSFSVSVLSITKGV